MRSIQDRHLATFAQDVRRDLTLSPKQLQSKYLYDELGSSLFEAICRLPWYRITRSETRLLAEHAADVVARLPESGSTLVELGVGSGDKLRLIAEALQARGAAAHLHLIDISSTALDRAAQVLSPLHFSVVGHQEAYELGLRSAAAQRASRAPMLVLFLGSNIGNFDSPAADTFLARIRTALVPGDLLLLGTDLAKPEEDLLLAYDDPLGVTAAFNRNLLVRINQELGGTFDLASFRHRAVWNAQASRIEMHLVSTRAQQVDVAAADLHVAFAAGEYIWTESSYKYDPVQVARMTRDAGFALEQQWIDEEARFALTLFAAD